jgi:hypothetical protein
MPNTAAEVERHGESRLATAGSIAEQERLDGNEVVAILEAPNLDFDDSEGIDTMLSTEGAQRLHAALFSDTADHRIHWDNLLNFWPDQGRRVFDEQNGQRLFGGGETLSPQAAWLRDWKDVLVHYADEVWGDLGLVAIQARGEVETAAESKSLPPLEALGRLRMILLHLRGAQ